MLDFVFLGWLDGWLLGWTSDVCIQTNQIEVTMNNQSNCRMQSSLLTPAKLA